MKNPYVDDNGTKRWQDEKGQLHRDDGPAIEYMDGTKHWYQRGKRHRIDAPATICSSGTEYWLHHGKYHRVDGPAIISCHGREDWYVRREDWYVNGEYIDIQPILERLDISPDWRSWTDAEKMIVRLAL